MSNYKPMSQKDQKAMDKFWVNRKSEIDALDWGIVNWENKETTNEDGWLVKRIDGRIAQKSDDGGVTWYHEEWFAPYFNAAMKSFMGAVYESGI